MDLHKKNKIFTKMYLLQKYKKINCYALVVESLKIAVKESKSPKVIFSRTNKIYKNLLKKLTIKEISNISVESMSDNRSMPNLTKKDVIENELNNRESFIMRLACDHSLRNKVLKDIING